MATVYSLRIAAFGSLTAGTGVVGPIVPAGLIYVVRDIDAYEHTGVTDSNLFLKNAIGGFLTGFIIDSAHPTNLFSWRGRQVYSEGEQVAILVGSGTWDIQVSGYQLTLP